MMGYTSIFIDVRKKTKKKKKKFGSIEHYSDPLTLKAKYRPTVRVRNKTAIDLEYKRAKLNNSLLRRLGTFLMISTRGLLYSYMYAEDYILKFS